jgi:hypothetical protein
MSFASREKAIFSQCEVGPPQPPLAWSSTPKRTCCVTPAATGTTRSGLALPSVDHQHAVYTARAPNRFKDFWRE